MKVTMNSLQEAIDRLDLEYRSACDAECYAKNAQSVILAVQKSLQDALNDKLKKQRVKEMVVQAFDGTTVTKALAGSFVSRYDAVKSSAQ